MRREGFELSVGKPRVILRKEEGGTTLEPFETLVVEVPHDKLGPVMELTGSRRGQLKHMGSRGEFAHTTFSIPARGLIGLRTRVLNATQGTAIMHHRFEAWRPLEGEVSGRANGVLVSMMPGRAVAFGLDGLQERADLFIEPGDEVFEGMICGVAGAIGATILLAVSYQTLLADRVETAMAGSGSPNAIAFPLLVVLLILAGLGIGALGSGLTMRRFLQV